MAARFAEQLAWIDSQYPRMAELVSAWSALNTGSRNLRGLAAFLARLDGDFSDLGGLETISLPEEERVDDTGHIEHAPLGAAVRLRSPGRQPDVPRVLLGIHMDTVFAADDPFQHVEQTRTGVGEGILRGPGVADAKGGLAVMLFALLALERSEWAGRLRWEVLVTPDEELGSPGSGSLWNEAAGRNDLGLLYEPALADGTLAGSRKGSGNFVFVVHGRGAHAGRNFTEGRSAVHAVAEAVGEIAALNGAMDGVTANVGVIRGGTTPNVVADLALCRANVRVATTLDQNEVESYLVRVAAKINAHDGLRCELHGRFHCPPKPLDEGTRRVLEALRDCGQRIGVPIAWKPTGGVCDGNRLAAAGLPTVDSLGVRGGNIHTDNEFVELASLTERAKLSALFLMRLAAGDISLPARSELHA